MLPAVSTLMLRLLCVLQVVAYVQQEVSKHTVGCLLDFILWLYYCASAYVAGRFSISSRIPTVAAALW